MPSSSGALPAQSPTGQLEALYIGWFGRAADPASFQQKMQSYLTQVLAGTSLSDAAIALSSGFATSPENAPYASLATLPTPVAAPTAAQQVLTAGFINQTYGNLFNRAATTAEVASWSKAFFDGTVPYASLVYDIAASATSTADVASLNAKIDAASYFTTATAGLPGGPPVPADMQAAVASVVDVTTELASQAATNALVSSGHVQVDYQTILSPGDITTGVRAALNGNVVLTGSQPTGTGAATAPFLFQGPLDSVATGSFSVLAPAFTGVTSATLYGPDTAIFTPAIGTGNVRAVGSFQSSASAAGVINHGMVYQGPTNGVGGTWTQVDVPSNGVNVVGGVVIGKTVADTILHSTMGNLAVGNYDLDPSGEAGANAFIYNLATQKYTLLTINGSYDNLTTLYGIWENGVGSTSYTIAGGTRGANGLNVAFLETYDSATGGFSNLAYYTGFNDPGVVTHFENITAVPGGFNLVATTDRGPASAAITVNADGSYGGASWTALDLPGNSLLTGNIAFENVVGGIYNTKTSTSAPSTYLGVVEQAQTSAAGGLIMPVGASGFTYALTVAASTGVTVVGSTKAGNVLGGSIGNDTITGSRSQADTIFTGGGADAITLSTGTAAQDRVELFAANASGNAAALSPGAPVRSVAGSIVSATDVPQLGWWGQATAQSGGPVSNAATNAGFGTGTSLDMSTVANFSAATDTVDIALNSFSSLLRGLGSGTAPTLGNAVFSNEVAPGGTVTVANADVLLLSKAGGFADAAAVAAELAVRPITFASAQTGSLNHYIVAYEDTGGNVRIADMDIHYTGGASFTKTNGGATLAVSDMAQLQGVSLKALQPANITFLSGNEVPGSTFLDFTGYRITNETTVAAAYSFDASKSVTVTSDPHFNVALVLERAQDPTPLLHSDWGTRQQTLKDLGDSKTLWSTYGADKTLYDSVVSQLKGPGYNLTVLDGSNSNYVSTAESRTIWVQINNSTDFQALFQTPLLQQSAKGGQVYWNGSLSLPPEWKVSGIWVDTTTNPYPSFLGGTATPLAAGAQSPGNSALPTIQQMFPQDVAALYNFPLDGRSVKTGTIGLIEPAVGTSLPGDPTGSGFQGLLSTYLATAQQTGTGVVLPPQGISGQSGSSGERSLDVGVVAAINPNSNLALYNGSGLTLGTKLTAGVFTAAQSAIWDRTYNPEVTSNSWGDGQSMSPGSPFYKAYWELFVDAALRNQTTFIALGDGGSGNEIGNGLTNLEYNVTQPYNILVGGSSISTAALAQADATLDYLLVPALAGDKVTIWQLVAGGLTQMPGSLQAVQRFVEAVWNTYYLNGNTITGIGNTDFYTGYIVNSTGSGGVDPTQPIPWYQAAYGLHPVTSDPYAQVGRGAPDVAAIGGGNLLYTVPPGDMVNTGYADGTSAASPLWAALAVQLNVIFNDQKLPNLGFMNDLLYIAAAVAPASFNDITVGNNTSSFYYVDAAGKHTYTTYENDKDSFLVDATGFGYSAGYGYDLATGLGSPNGLLLARSLTAIAHSQVSYSSLPHLLDSHDTGWTSGVDQALLFQTMSPGGASVGIDIGSSHVGYASAASGAFAWTSRFAQQALQSDFDPALVVMFDKQPQGTVAQSSAEAGQLVAVGINAQGASAIQGTLTTDFGFADFMSSSGVVRVARAVAVAETVGGLNDQTAIARLRQGGQDTVKIDFYRVDDYAGTIGGIAPGAAGYAAAAHDRLYQLDNGGTSATGPGYGVYAEARLLHVNSGDLVAMTLTNQTASSTFWGFAQANEQVAGQGVGHLWSYGLNTWGWEDLPGGGDHDYNDLLVQLDFTSSYGRHLIA